MRKRTYLILDYNNVRFTDVAKMRKILRADYDLDLCLIRPNPSPRDLDVADYFIDLSFSSKTFVQDARREIERLAIDVAGGFPFSDKAVVSGTKLLAELGAFTDSYKLAQNADSKWMYRETEKTHRELLSEQNIYIPFSELVTEYSQVLELLQRSEFGIVLKPTHEGNNRGVSVIRSEAQAELAWKEALPWFRDGLIVEEIIPFDPEFSHDGVAHLDWVTRKYSLRGTYPVEKGQEVSSESDPTSFHRVQKTGRLVNYLTGSQIGAFHNEVRFDKRTGRTAVIEPNRRPAGMCIWDLAERVYRMSFYKLLIDSTLGHDLPLHLPQPRGTAAIRMLEAGVDGPWEYESSSAERWYDEILTEMRRTHYAPIDFSGFRVLKAKGEFVYSVPRQNGDFVAQICAYGPNSKDVHLALDRFESLWRKKVAAVVERETA